MLAAKGRRWPCVLLGALPMALVLCNHLLRHQGQLGYWAWWLGRSAFRHTPMPHAESLVMKDGHLPCPCLFWLKIHFFTDIFHSAKPLDSWLRQRQGTTGFLLTIYQQNIQIGCLRYYWVLTVLGSWHEWEVRIFQSTQSLALYRNSSIHSRQKCGSGEIDAS